jgi:uncharacterized protein YndB with AHSA1/START domain
MGPSSLQISTPTDREVVLTRVFNAPRDLVFRALSQPDLLKRWCGPTDWTMAVCEVDFQVGGKWRFVMRRPDGKEFGQFGVYREIVPTERIVNTELWDDWDAGETLVTTHLAERDGQTTFTSTILFPSQQVRDTVLKGGLEHGAAESYDKLAELLATS